MARKSNVALGVGKVRSPSSDVMDDDTEPPAACLSNREVRATYLDRAQKAPLASVIERKIGDRITTKWGVATIVLEHTGGGFECSWEHESGTFRMDFHDEDEPMPGARRSVRKRLTADDLTTEVSNAV